MHRMILYLSSDWHCHKTISKVQNKPHLKTSKLVSEWNQVSFTGTCYIEMKDIFKTNQKSNQLSAQIFILKGKNSVHCFTRFEFGYVYLYLETIKLCRRHYLKFKVVTSVWVTP